jgi:D-hydroxyproline dehydrogenase subunit alpha
MTMPDEPGHTSVAIVGGGPAGVQAARALSEQGVRVALLDESPELGGQYYKHYGAVPGVVRSRELDDRHQEGLDLIATLDHEYVTYLPDTTVWGLFEGNELALYREERVETLIADAVILATGATERLHAFPGWTLPGVMTAGGAQSILSREAILPGRRFLVAGSGPLLLAIANEIAEAGGDVLAVIEGSSTSAPLRHIHRFLRQMSRVRQAIDYRRSLRTHGVSIENGQTVVRAEGHEALERVTVARVDRDWRPVPGSERTYDVDTLCLNYGFCASLELARMIGCDVSYDRLRGGWHVQHDDGMRTSQARVYVAGQAAGIGGADLAAATGRLAGATVARDLGAIGERAYDGVAPALRRTVTQMQDAAAALNDLYTPGAGLADLVTPDTIVCRCEDVLASSVQAAIEEGARSVNDVKRRTRCGMGFCQGRICAPTIASYLDRHAGATPESAGLLTARPPVKPIPLSALARAASRT